MIFDIWEWVKLIKSLRSAYLFQRADVHPANQRQVGQHHNSTAQWGKSSVVAWIGGANRCLRWIVYFSPADTLWEGLRPFDSPKPCTAERDGLSRAGAGACLSSSLLYVRYNKLTLLFIALYTPSWVIRSGWEMTWVYSMYKKYFPIKSYWRYLPM